VGALLWQVVLAGYLFEPLATNFTQDRPPFCDMQPPPKSPGVYSPSLKETAPEKVELWNNNPQLRYVPALLGTVGHYLWAVSRGALGGIPLLLVVAMIVLVLLALPARVLARLRGRLKSWTPTTHSTPPVRSSWLADGFTQLHWSWGLMLGFIVGFIGTAGITSICWHTAPGKMLSTTVGREIVRFAGWGKAEARHQFVDRALDIDEKWEALSPAELEAGPQEYYNRWFDETDPTAFGTVKLLRPYYPVIGAFFVGSGLIILAYLVFWCIEFIWPPQENRLITPASGLLFILHIILVVNIFGSYFAATPHLFNLLLLFLMLTSGVVYKLRFRNISTPNATQRSDFYERTPPVMLTDYPRDHCGLLVSEMIAFCSKDGKLDTQAPKRPLAIVCVSGGGSRAAAWTMRMLTELEEQFEKRRQQKEFADQPWAKWAFPYDIRLITGASGGMIAGGYYVAGLDKPDPTGAVQRVSVTREDGTCTPLTSGDINRDIRRDFLTPIARSMAFWDFWTLFHPAVIFNDRGNELEKNWNLCLRGVMQNTFKTLADGEQQGWRPSLIFTPMTVEDGRQLFISNLSLSKITENRANILRGPDEKTADTDTDTTNLLSREGWQFFKLFPEARDAFELGTAARMSASFPYILPAVELPTQPPLRVVDAGYYDNYGVTIASEWLYANMDWVKENCSGVVIIQIRDGVSEEARQEQTKGLAERPGPGRLGRGLQWLTSPVEGLYNFRSQATAYRNDNLLALLHHSFLQRGFDEKFFQTVAFELLDGDKVSLNFALTDEECDNIDTAANTSLVQQRITRLIDWWSTRPVTMSID
jgi:hypothetical protein